MPLKRSSPLPAPSAAPTVLSVYPTTLTRGSADQRWEAARAVAALPDAVGLLSRALANESDLRVREAIFTSLARIATPDSVDAVIACLHSDSATLRTGALDALHAMPQATAARLPGLLSDPDPDVRLLSCELVRDQPDAEANRLLRDLLRRETVTNVCAAAIEVIAETGGPDMLDTLELCGRRFAHEPFLAFSIDAAIERIGAQAALSRE